MDLILNNHAIDFELRVRVDKMFIGSETAKPSSQYSCIHLNVLNLQFKLYTYSLNLQQNQMFLNVGIQKQNKNKTDITDIKVLTNSNCWKKNGDVATLRLPDLLSTHDLEL